MTATPRLLTLVCVLSLPILVRAQGVTAGPIDQVPEYERRDDASNAEAEIHHAAG